MEKLSQYKKYLMIAGSLLLLLVSFLFVFQPQMERMNEIKAENQELEQKVNDLLEIQSQQSYYVSETEKMQAEVDAYLDSFPSDVKEEDMIALALQFEDLTQVDISGISIGDKTEVGSIESSSEESTSVSGTSTAQSDATESNSTENALGESTTASINGADSTTVTDSTVEPAMTLYNTMTAYDYRTDYSGLKKIMESIFKDTKRRTIDSISVNFDSSSGYISGTMNINAFTMSGTGLEYEEPSVPSVETGVSDPFKALENDSENDNNSRN
ncbi:MAG: hypothetical protein Q4B70_07650 [Lachnospiraceae bacterium]|nr:hypothetical protein [Lachnospiraceae bacterium]